MFNKRLKRLSELMLGSNPSIEEIVKSELYEAESRLLNAQSDHDLARATVDYHTNRVARLRRKLQEYNTSKAQLTA